MTRSSARGEDHDQKFSTWRRSRLEKTTRNDEKISTWKQRRLAIQADKITRNDEKLSRKRTLTCTTKTITQEQRKIRHLKTKKTAT